MIIVVDFAGFVGFVAVNRARYLGSSIHLGNECQDVVGVGCLVGEQIAVLDASGIGPGESVFLVGIIKDGGVGCHCKANDA